MIKYLNPLAWARWSGQFFILWCLSIPWRYVSMAVPASILTILFCVFSFVAYSDGGTWRKGLIASQLRTSMLEENYPTAELLVRRQIEEGDTSSELIFQLASLKKLQDESDDAVEIMRELAMDRRYEQAALWLIQEVYLGKKWQELSEEQQNEFGRLLALAVEKRPKELQIKQLYADYLIASNRFSQAIPYLRELADVQPMRGLQAAALARRLGNEELANRLAETTLDKVDQLFSEEPANPILALAVVQNQIFLDRHADAVRTLNDSIGRMKTEQHQQQLQQAMGDTIVAWVTKIESTPNDSENDRLRVLKMLQVALQYAPNNPRVLTLVADQVLKTLESDDEAVVAIRNALVQGTSPGIAHFVRGTSYLMKDDTERATRHLKLAAEHLPNSSAILNNLAVALASRPGSDLNEALKLSQQAIAQTPQPGPFFFETRGQIYFKLKRYMDAIPDMERALASSDLAVSAHTILANCYDELGEPELAEDHRRAGELLKAEAIKKQEESRRAGKSTSSHIDKLKNETQQEAAEENESSPAPEKATVPPSGNSAEPAEASPPAAAE